MRECEKMAARAGWHQVTDLPLVPRDVSEFRHRILTGATSHPARSTYPILPSSYDQDMFDIEMFVDAKQHPENASAQINLHNFYMNMLARYWRTLDTYLNGPVVTQDIATTPAAFFSELATSSFHAGLSSALERTRTAYRDDNASFRQKLDDLNQRFARMRIKRVDMRTIWQLFEHIVRLFCLNSSLEIDADPSFPLDQYPLANDTGRFGLNTWLYAYFEDVFLVGVPTTIQFFKLEPACPHRIMLGEKDDNKRIDELFHPLTKDLLKNVYYLCVNNARFTSMNKELMVLHLWCVVRAFSSRGDTSTILRRSPVQFFNMILRPEFVPLVIEFEPEYLRFIQSPAHIHYFREAHDHYLTWAFSSHISESGQELAGIFEEYEKRQGRALPTDTTERTAAYARLRQQMLHRIQFLTEEEMPAANALTLYLMVHWVARHTLIMMLQLPIETH